jgi:2-phosphosulfolactate phosphatase
MASVALWKTWENDVEGCLRIASHGQRLAGIGNHDDDFASCASLDNLSVIPKQIEMGVLRSN